MYSQLVIAQRTETARPRPADAYDFFTYRGAKPIRLEYRGNPVDVTKGTRFGVRKSASGKLIRLVLNDDVNRVFTIDLPTAKRLAKGVGASK